MLVCTVLQQEPTDADALQIKCVSLIKLGRFEESFQVAETSAAKSPGFLLYERIYSLYRLRRFENASALLAAVPEQSRDEGFLHLEAQIVPGFFFSDRVSSV